MASDSRGKDEASYDELMRKLVDKLTEVFNNKEINVIEAVGIYVIVERLINRGWISNSEYLENIVNELVSIARGRNTTLSSLGLSCLLSSIND